jgi:hypothetical protein
MANTYLISLYNVPNLGGNKFINGIILGSAEISSVVMSGIMLSSFPNKPVFRFFIIVAVVFGGINIYFARPDSLLQYITLFFSIQGVGGSYNCGIIQIANSVPTSIVGGTITFCMTLGLTVSLGVPLIVLLPQPMPYLIMSVFFAITFFLTFSDVIKEPSFMEDGYLDSNLEMIEDAWQNAETLKKIN